MPSHEEVSLFCQHLAAALASGYRHLTPAEWAALQRSAAGAGR